MTLLQQYHQHGLHQTHTKWGSPARSTCCSRPPHRPAKGRNHGAACAQLWCRAPSPHNHHVFCNVGFCVFKTRPAGASGGRTQLDPSRVLMCYGPALACSLPLQMLGAVHQSSSRTQCNMPSRQAIHCTAAKASATRNAPLPPPPSSSPCNAMAHNTSSPAFVQLSHAEARKAILREGAEKGTEASHPFLACLANRQHTVFGTRGGWFDSPP